MVAPIDYTLPGVQSPFQALAQGMQFGTQMATAEAQRQEAERRASLVQAQVTAQQQALERQQALAQSFTRLSDRVRSGAATAADFQEFALMAPKDQAESAIKFFEAQSSERKNVELGHLSQVASALGSKTPEIGVRLLRERAEGFRNRGDAEAAKRYDVWAQMAEVDPVEAQTGVLVGASILPGGDKVVAAWEKSREEQRKAQLFGPQYRTAVALADKGEADAKAAGVTAEFARPMAQAGLTKAQSEAITAASNARFADALNEAGLNERNWNVRNVQNQINIRGAQLGLDREKVGSEVALNLARVAELATSLPEQAKKDINDAAVTAGTSKQQAMQLNSLAAKLDQEGGGWGLAARGAEWFKRATGSEGYVSSLRQEFTRLRNNAVVQALPKGAASDRDIALMLEGFPPATADAKYMASFLRGMAKSQEIIAATENARVDWLSQNRGSLGRARSEFKAGDFTAQPGETWVDLSQRIAADVAGRYATGGAPGAPIPTTMPPAPAAPAMPPGFRLITPPR